MRPEIDLWGRVPNKIGDTSRQDHPKPEGIATLVTLGRYLLPIAHSIFGTRGCISATTRASPGSCSRAIQRIPADEGER
jgi:hypothetical protein